MSIDIPGDNIDRYILLTNELTLSPFHVPLQIRDVLHKLAYVELIA